MTIGARSLIASPGAARGNLRRRRSRRKTGTTSRFREQGLILHEISDEAGGKRVPGLVPVPADRSAEPVQYFPQGITVARSGGGARARQGIAASAVTSDPRSSQMGSQIKHNETTISRMNKGFP